MADARGDGAEAPGLSSLAWPLSYLGACAAMMVLLAAGVPDYGALGIMSLAMWGLLAVSERRWPRVPAWRAPDGQVGKDLLHTVFGFLLGSMLGSALATEGLGRLVGSTAWWPDAWPLAFQVLLALTVFEIGSYGQHRLVHRLPWAFPFHAVHHNPRRLVLLKTTRNHALDIGTATFLSIAPLALLGASPRVILWVNVLNNVSALIQHANLRMPTPRWLDLIVSTPRNHQLHHGRSLVDSNRNYAMNLMLFDHLFGSFAWRGERLGADGCGLPDDDGTRGFLAETMPRARRRAEDSGASNRSRS